MSNVPRPGAAGAFVAIWTMMMVAMMLPSLWPTLRRYHRALDALGISRSGLRTLIVGVAYTGVWVGVGILVFAVDAAFGAAAVTSSASSRTAQLAAGGVVLAAGALQLTRWKAYHLARCRDVLRPCDAEPMSNPSAWRAGTRLGLHCSMSCIGPMATLLVIGMMDVRAMVVVTVVITAERVVPAGARIARATGAVALATGILVLSGALRLV